MRKKREFLRERFFRQINRVRMENLRSRISPHFTFNVLGREINQFNGSEEVKHNLMELVKYLRRSLELTEKLSVSLQDELDFVRTYIELERGRVGEDFCRNNHGGGRFRCNPHHDSIYDCANSGGECY